MSKDGYVARLRLDDEGVSEIRIHPTVLDDSYQPTVAHGSDFERILQRLQRLSEPHGARVSVTASGDAFEARALRDGMSSASRPRDRISR